MRRPFNTVGMHMSTICLKPWHAHLRRTGAVRANVLTIFILRMKSRGTHSCCTCMPTAIFKKDSP